MYHNLKQIFKKHLHYLKPVSKNWLKVKMPMIYNFNRLWEFIFSLFLGNQFILGWNIHLISRDKSYCLIYTKFLILIVKLYK